MKEFKYTIDGQEYTVQIEGVEGNIASLNVNGEAFKVEMEKEAEPEKKKVVLGQPASVVHLLSLPQSASRFRQRSTDVCRCNLTFDS